MGVIFCGTLIKSSTSKLVKRYVQLYFMSIIIYTFVWILISIAMVINKKNTLFDQSAEIILDPCNLNLKRDLFK